MKREIAIIGMAGRFPDAPDLRAFLRNLREGRDSVKPLSRSRIEATSLPPEKDYQVLGFLEEIDCFDCKFFGISPAEAREMDPHQRLLLQVIHHALEDSGHSASSFENTRTAVFCGDLRLDYYQLATEFSPTLLTGNLPAATAGRIARHFNLLGNALMVDTACSSSLVALHLACQELILGDADMAVVCGANLSLFPPEKSAPGLGVISPSGKAKTFSAEADGSARGEAVAAVLLKTLDRALADGDRIHAVVRATAVNQDAGRSASLTAPNPVSQAEVISSAWEKAEIDPATIGFIEAHGTATKLGDPIEIEGINKAFAKFTEKKKFCAISALKTNIGHCDSAAGIAGLIKTVLSLKHKELFPIVHFNQANPLIDFENSAVYVNNRLETWNAPTGQPRRAGLSAFGLSGTNCHALIEEAPHCAIFSTQKGQYQFIGISAKSVSALKSYAEVLASNLREDSTLKLDEIAHTLAAGRCLERFRLATVASSLADLERTLSNFYRAQLPLEECAVAELWFVFSHDIPVDGAELKALQSEDGFNKHFQQCLEQFPALESHTECKRFTIQYALYWCLYDRGIRNAKLTGSGAGKLVIDSIKGRLSLKEALARAAELKDLAPQDLSGRMREFVQREIGTKRALIVEMGHSGAISKTLLSIKASADNYEVHNAITDEPGRSIPTVLEKLYLLGCRVDWSLAVPHGRIADLPGYQFDKTRCWLREPSRVVDSRIENWFHDLSWIPAGPITRMGTLAERTLLVAGAQTDVAEALIAQFEQSGNRCIRADFGTRFANTARGFELAAGSESDHEKLSVALKERRIQISGIVHLGAFRPRAAYDSSRTDSELEPGLYSQFLLARTFSRELKSNDFLFVAISSDGQRVLPDDRVAADRAACAAFCRSLLADHPTLNLRFIDTNFGTDTQLAAAIYREVASDERLRFVSIRGGNRYVQRFSKAVRGQSGTIQFHQRDGVYLITGGASGIGLEVARQLASRGPCSLHLVGRSNDRNQAVAALKELGAHVAYYCADVTARIDMNSVFTEIASAHGKLDGIIHCAGITGKWVPLAEKSFADFRATLSPKTRGALLLTELSALHNLAPKYEVLFSSLNSIVPQKFSGDYAAANAFSDALALDSRIPNTTLLSIAWPAWREAGIAVRDGAAKLVDNDQPDDGSLKSLSTRDGLAVLERAIERGNPYSAVADVNLRLFANNPYFLIQEEQAAKTLSPASPEKAQVAAPAKPALMVSGENVSGTEQALGAIWAEVLGLESLSANDDFFDLGGHSLNGVQIVNRTKKTFNIKLDFEDIFEYTTLRSLAGFIDAQTKPVKSKPQPEKAAVETGIPHIADQEYYDVSHAQRRLWVLHQMEANPLAYNNPGAFVFKGPVNENAFAHAFETLIQRHESLRTTFILVDGVPKQKVHKSSNFKIEFIDLRNTIDPDAGAAELLDREFKTAFDLQSGPLLRCKLIRLADERYTCLLWMHHIVSDAWTMGVLFREVLVLYSAFAHGRPNPLPIPRIQYRDYAAWQNAELAKQGENSHRKYWMDKMSGDLPVLNLPTDKPRPVLKTYAGAEVKSLIPRELAESLRAACRKNGATLFMALVSAVKILLARYTGQDDIIVGSPIAGRHHSDLEDQIGFFVNTLVLRDRILPSDSFNRVLTQVKQSTTQAYDHQSYPFDLLVDDLNPPRDTSRSPLFDVMVMMQGNVRSEYDFKEFEIEHSPWEVRASQFDLTFNFREAGDPIELRIDYNTDLFAPERIKRIGEHLRVMLAHVLSNPDAPVANAALLSPHELAQLESFNATECHFGEYDQHTIVSVFERQAAQTPDAIAVTFASTRWTYRELNERANQIAHALNAKFGIQPDGIVGLLCERSEWMIAAMLGIQKAGGAYIPVDPAAPRSRVASILRGSGCNVVLTETGCIPLLPPADGWQVFNMYDARENYSVANPMLAAGPRNLAYGIYTSGSTGTPKGVLIEHRQVLNLVGTLRQRIYNRHSGIRRVSLISTYVFDACIQQIYGALFQGHTLCIVDELTKREGSKLNRWLVAMNVNLADCTPSQLAIVDQGAGNSETLNHLMHVIIGGESLPGTLVRSVSRRAPKLGLTNVYGPAECCVDSTMHPINPEIDGADTVVSIGRPVANSKIHILDSQRQRVPIGIPGEICVAGVAVGRGYLNNSELTAAKFVSDPFCAASETETAKMYLTGDLGRWREDGTIEYLGRNDRQIKIRGFRIEPGEIETRLRECKAVKDAFVISREITGDRELVAYLIGASSADITEIREHLRRTVPDYMVPGHFVLLNEFPLNASGKVDAGRLPMPNLSGETSGQTSVAPRNDIEEKIEAVWRAVLGREQIGVFDNFFDLGGHSLKATRVVSRLQNELNAELSLVDIFRNPTIAGLAEAARNRKADASPPQHAADSATITNMTEDELRMLNG